MRKAMVLGVLGLAGTLASPAFADDFSGFRMGLTLGSEQLESDFVLDPPDGDVDQLNTNRFGYGLMAGWALNRWFALEGSLQGGSEFSNNTFTEDFAPDAYLVSRTELRGAEVTAVGTAWIGRKFAFFGRAGMFAWKADQTTTAGFYDDPTSKLAMHLNSDGFDPVFGVGIQTVLDNALIRVEYKMTELSDVVFTDKGDPDDTTDDVDVYGLRDQKVSSLNFSIVWTIH